MLIVLCWHEWKIFHSCRLNQDDRGIAMTLIRKLAVLAVVAAGTFGNALTTAAVAGCPPNCEAPKPPLAPVPDDEGRGGG